MREEFNSSFVSANLDVLKLGIFRSSSSFKKKMKFKIGQAVLFDGEGFFSSCIRFYNRVKYHERGWTHVGIITMIKGEYVLIHEAISKGFVCRAYKKSDLKQRISDGTMKLKNPRFKLKDVRKCANNYLGRPYGYRDILSIATSMILGFRLLRATGAKQIICSEAVSRVYYDATAKKMDISKEFCKSFDLVTPTEIDMSKCFY